MIKGVIFDLDGTVVDASYDWAQIKSELNTRGKPILYFINDLKEPEKSLKLEILKRYESEATLKAVLVKGMRQFLDFLTAKGIKKALVTNNSQKNVNFLLRKFSLEFDCVICRDSGLWKPSGAPFLAVMKKLKLRKEECCVIGDSHIDVKAAKEAGIKNVYILNKDKEKFELMQAKVFDTVRGIKKSIEKLLIE